MNTEKIISTLLNLPKPDKPCFDITIVAPYFDGDYGIVRANVIASHEITCDQNIFGEKAMKVEINHVSLADVHHNNDSYECGKLLLESKYDCYEDDYPVFIQVTDNDGELKQFSLDSLFDKAENPKYLTIKSLLEDYIFPYSLIEKRLNSVDAKALISLFPA